MAAVLAPLILGACGTSREEAARVSFDARACTDRFNTERASDFGVHAHGEHAARRARIHAIDGNCAVTFVVPKEDEEYGAVGEFVSGDAWVSLAMRGETEAAEIQTAARAAANADVDAAGQVTLR